MQKDELIAAERLRKLLDYDPDTGVLTWRQRDESSFLSGKQPAEIAAKKWNTRYAGKPAGSINNHGYLRVFINDQRYAGHRIAWAIYHGEWPDDCIDHINGKTADNRILNLRVVTRQGNMMNLRRAVNNKSGCPGVRWRGERSAWVASIQIAGAYKHLGLFQDFNAAVAARKQAEKELGFHANHGKARP